MYASLQDCVNDLEKSGQLLRIKSPLDPNLEIAEVHRRIFESGGPAILFEKVIGSPFRGLSNIYGTFERTDWLFRKTLKKVQKVTELKADPANFLKNPTRYLSTPFTALYALPTKALFSKPAMYGQTTIDQLPLIKSWPMDGGAFVTMPQVMSLPPGCKNMMQSNLGMYRIQLTGNDYKTNEEIGLHYQLHRGIGVHHKEYLKSNEPFRVSVFVGGPPSHAFSAIMPMPEGLSELTFAGMLAGRRFRYAFDDMGHAVSTDADFVITGTIDKKRQMPEGPFGDHLGYYSLTHDFPVMKVDRVYHRKDAIWLFSIVGRPPMEDSSFGYLIHKLVKALTPGEFPGLRSINAVDASGVHPLLLAVGGERYMPFRERVPEEIITIGNRILGSGQTSLAKFLFIAADDDDPKLDSDNIEHFFYHFLQRVDWTRDLHFQTKTTIDTLDYSGNGWNAGSKVLIACRGEVKRELAKEISSDLTLPKGYNDAHVALPGILALQAPKFTSQENATEEMEILSNNLKGQNLEKFPLVLVVDDSKFTSATLNNYLWVTYTRANPSHDIYGVDSYVEHKHWGCLGSLIIDARIKPHHAPELVQDPAVTKKVDKLFSKGGELYKFK